MSRFSFEYPWVFALILLFVLCAYKCKERSLAIFFPHLSELMASSVARRSWANLLKWLGIAMAITALASPVITEDLGQSKKKGRDIVMVLDSSDSMRQRGFDPNDFLKTKFDVVKEVVEDFIKKRVNDRIGLVTFADIAFIASPLTFEKSFLRDVVRLQHLGVAGKRTAINDALVQAYRLLDKSDAKSKVIILLTDGIDNMSRIGFDDVRKLIKRSSKEVKLYTIGIGRPGDYNAAYLDALAKAGGGMLFEARNANDLARVYAQIDTLEKSEIKAKKILRHTYLYIYPLIVAVIALLTYLFLRSRV